MPQGRRRHVWAYVLGSFVIVVIVVVALWDWDWFVPLVNSQATAALGRPTTIQHLNVKLGRTTTVTVTDLDVANAEGLGDGKPLVHVAKLTAALDVLAYVHSRQVVIPQITADQPVIEADQDASGHASWDGLGGGSSSGASKDPNAGPKIGAVVINGGQAHVAMAKLKADFDLGVATRSADDVTGSAHDTAAANGGQIVVDAKGTYAAQPITGQLVGGALLSLRDAAHPYPIDMHLANGPTRIALDGTVQNPLNFAGADLKLKFEGPNMGLLLPLTGIPFPQTPPYSLTGNFDYSEHKFRFTQFAGRLGSSDLNGDILVDPTQARPFVEATLFSHKVDLTDLGGFIGATPGRKDLAGQTPAQKAELAHAEASPRALPNTPINLPKLNAANVQLRYKGEHILGRGMPLDNIVANIDVDDGRFAAHPISFAVGSGLINIDADFAPAAGHDFKTKADVQFKRVDVAKLMASTGAVEGAGTMSGSATLDSTGNSMASLLAHGDGGVRLGIGSGNLSALLVDIAGLEFGNALLSALGVPNRAQIQCLAVNMPLKHGTLDTQAFLLDTSEAQVVGTGSINLANETIDMKLKTAPKHFTVGSLPTPIDLGGTFKSPAISPEKTPLALRAGAAVGLGILFPPAALLPLIQFGIGDDNSACQVAEAPIANQVNAAAGGKPVMKPAANPVVHHAPVRRH